MSYGDDVDVEELDRFYKAYNRIVWPFHLLLPRNLREIFEAYRNGGAYQFGLSVYDYLPKGNGYWQRILRWLFPMLTEFEQSDFYKHMEQLYSADILIPQKTEESDYAHNIGNKALGLYIRHTDRSGFVNILLFLKDKNIFPDGDSKGKFLDKLFYRAHRLGAYGDRTPLLYHTFNRCESLAQVSIERANLELMNVSLQTMEALGLLDDSSEGLNNVELMLEHSNPADLLNICLLLCEELKKEELSQPSCQSIFTIISRHKSLEYVFGSERLSDQVGRNRYGCVSLFEFLEHASKKTFMSFQFLLILAKSSEPVSIYNILFLLDKQKLISHPVIVKHLPHIVEHLKPNDVFAALQYLFEHERHMLDLPYFDDCFQFIAESANPHDMAIALVVLIKAGMINDSTWITYFKDILQPHYTKYGEYRRIMAQGICNLDKHGILNQRHVDFIAGDCAIGHSQLLVELNKAGLLQPQHAERYLNMIEHHKNPFSLTRALILREYYKVRFTEHDTEISDDTLMACNDAAVQVQWIALKRFIGSLDGEQNQELDRFIADVDRLGYIPSSNSCFNKLFRLDRTGRLAVNDKAAMLALLKSINQHIAARENDLSDSDSDSDSNSNSNSNSNVETNRFFNRKWCRDYLSIFEKREYVRRQLIAEEPGLDCSMT